MRAARVLLFGLVACQALLGEGAVKRTQRTETGQKSWSTIADKLNATAQKAGSTLGIAETVLNGVEGKHTCYAAVIDDTNLHGGALVHKNFVLTSASAVDQGKNVDKFVKVVLGLYSNAQTTATSEQTVPHDHIHMHPDYDCVKLHNDIAVLWLETDVVMTEFIQPVNVYMGSDIVSKKSFLYGWGTVDMVNETAFPVHMHELEQTIQEMSYCTQYPEFADMLDTMHICTAQPDDCSGACIGDEGGPLIMEDTDTDKTRYLVGIISFQPYACGKENDFPTRHTKLGGYFGWLSQWITFSGGAGGGGGGGGAGGGGAGGGGAGGGGAGGGGSLCGSAKKWKDLVDKNLKAQKDQAQKGNKNQEAVEMESEKQKRKEKRKEKQKEMKKQKELKKQKEMEMLKEKQKEMEKQKQKENEQEMEKQKQNKLEKQKQNELEKQKQKELEKQKQNELEKQNKKELEKQKRKEKREQMKKQREIERQKKKELEKNKQEEKKKEGDKKEVKPAVSSNSTDSVKPPKKTKPPKRTNKLPSKIKKPQKGSSNKVTTNKNKNKNNKKNPKAPKKQNDSPDTMM